MIPKNQKVVTSSESTGYDPTDDMYFEDEKNNDGTVMEEGVLDKDGDLFYDTLSEPSDTKSNDTFVGKYAQKGQDGPNKGK
ncbi:hypothetical protein [Candidatus Bandiella euplotis]|uniref:Uncharacterized protein n=1 Tax=Candidatus Bandiella euplotis TaxID=1664265 RepID=A0ABZ0UNT1_9RICK|nr:hypothetical protein [Candidatus Bandiella woodruffii]WPX96358.1 hypothetical protein Bandiella_00468 [Candidatus Bandiella woodruffii]